MEQLSQRNPARGVSPEACVTALSRQFASRGLAKHALEEAKRQIAAEEKTRELAPCAYRLSLLSEGAVAGVYKRGKDTMSAEDLVRYAEESRRMLPVSEEPETEMVIHRLPEKTEETAVTTVASKGLRQASADLIKKGREMYRVWFDATPNTVKSEKRFPLSAFAAVCAVAVSLMLIVSGALMVSSEKTQISRLNGEIAELSAEVADLEEDLKNTSDLMEIRRIAMEEYGMVEEEYLRSEYLTIESEEKIEVFETKKKNQLSLDAILSAIGWK
ncbi:MAG: hypothetical protein E7620_08145 [Ruminococcaceae bacterium]|nr:hypothetical protein [Oscillospiraceae bacterium]